MKTLMQQFQHIFIKVKRIIITLRVEQSVGEVKKMRREFILNEKNLIYEERRSSYKHTP